MVDRQVGRLSTIDPAKGADRHVNIQDNSFDSPGSSVGATRNQRYNMHHTNQILDSQDSSKSPDPRFVQFPEILKSDDQQSPHLSRQDFDIKKLGKFAPYTIGYNALNQDQQRRNKNVDRKLGRAS